MLQIYQANGGSAGGSLTMDDVDPYGIHHRISGTNSDDDEFSSNTIADYTAVNPSGSATWTIQNHVLSGIISGQSAADLSALLKPMTLADGEAFEIRSQVLTDFPGDYAMVGIVLTNGTSTSSGALVAMSYQYGITNKYALELWKGTLDNISSNSSSFLFNMYGLTGWRTRLKRNSSTSYSALASLEDGVNFSDFGAGTSDPEFTPTHAGVFATVWGGSQTFHVSFDFIRHI